LEGFSWGHAFFEVNGDLLAKYAECRDADEIARVQESHLSGLERDYIKSRETKEGEDEWAGGNPNHITTFNENSDEDEDESDDDDDNQGSNDEEEAE
jgi:pre-rRNA-processing protein TSR3